MLDYAAVSGVVPTQDAVEAPAGMTKRRGLLAPALLWRVELRLTSPFCFRQQLVGQRIGAWLGWDAVVRIPALRLRDGVVSGCICLSSRYPHRSVLGWEAFCSPRLVVGAMLSMAQHTVKVARVVARTLVATHFVLDVKLGVLAVLLRFVVLLAVLDESPAAVVGPPFPIARDFLMPGGSRFSLMELLHESMMRFVTVLSFGARLWSFLRGRRPVFRVPHFFLASGGRFVLVAVLPVPHIQPLSRVMIRVVLSDPAVLRALRGLRAPDGPGAIDVPGSHLRADSELLRRGEKTPTIPEHRCRHRDGDGAGKHEGNHYLVADREVRR